MNFIPAEPNNLTTNNNTLNIDPKNRIPLNIRTKSRTSINKMVLTEEGIKTKTTPSIRQPYPVYAKDKV